MVYGRLCRYAGRAGLVYPSISTLASELGIGKTQARSYVRELEREGFIAVDRENRHFAPNGTGGSNRYVFLWHVALDGEQGELRKAPPVRKRGGVPLRKTEALPLRKTGDEENHYQESHLKESQNIDLDSPTSNRKNRDSRPDGGDARAACKQYPRLRDALADYMITTDDPERVYPSDRQVVDVMDGAGAGEEDVILCLWYLREERGLRPGSRHGPRHFSWFRTVVADYFRQKRVREEVYAGANVEWDQRNGLSDSEFDSMTDAIEVDGV